MFFLCCSDFSFLFGLSSINCPSIENILFGDLVPALINQFGG
jgi:hypothetical protein